MDRGESYVTAMEGGLESDDGREGRMMVITEGAGGQYPLTRFAECVMRVCDVRAGLVNSCSGFGPENFRNDGVTEMSNGVFGGEVISFHGMTGEKVYGGDR